MNLGSDINIAIYNCLYARTISWFPLIDSLFAYPFCGYAF